MHVAITVLIWLNPRTSHFQQHCHCHQPVWCAHSGSVLPHGIHKTLCMARSLYSIHTSLSNRVYP